MTTYPTEPIDQTLRAETGNFDPARPLYLCQVCDLKGESNIHMHVDECPYYEALDDSIDARGELSPEEEAIMRGAPSW